MAEDLYPPAYVQDNAPSPSPAPQPDEQWKSTVTVLLLLLFTPVGVIVMWFLVSWPKWVKALITFVVFLPLLLGIIFFSWIFDKARDVAYDAERNIEHLAIQNASSTTGVNASSTYATHVQGNYETLFLEPLNPFSKKYLEWEEEKTLSPVIRGLII